METVREGPPVEPDGRNPIESNEYSPDGEVRSGPVLSSEVDQETPATGIANSTTEKIPKAFHPPVPSFPATGAQVQQPKASVIPGKNLQSVVTTSFSVEDSSLSPGRYHISVERRDPGDSPPTSWQRTAIASTSNTKEKSPLSRPPSAIVVGAASPRSNTERRSLPIMRSYSSTTADSYGSLPMKRNFFHHVTQNTSYVGLPPDFVPPKRTKGTSGRPVKGNVVLEARPEQSRAEARQWYPQSPRWESHFNERSGYAEDPVAHMRSRSFPTPYWMGQVSPSRTASKQHRRGHYKPSNHMEDATMANWRPPYWYPPHPVQHPMAPWRVGQQAVQNRDDMETSQARTMHREMRESFDEESRDSSSMGYTNRNAIFRNTSVPSSYGNTNDKMQLVMQAASFTEGRTTLSGGTTTGVRTSSLSQQGGSRAGMLLAMPEDQSSLSETLCVIRENIEVFQATQADVDAPAPGRKHPIVVGQVGLRCIHCRHTKKASDRVKRAVCYPVSLKRIYRTVVDMKLDHFTQCKFVPPALKQRLNELKSGHTRSTGTTMQYFIQSAMTMGMIDGPSGIRLSKSMLPPPVTHLRRIPSAEKSKPRVMNVKAPPMHRKPESTKGMKRQSGESSVSSMEISKRSDSMASGESFDSVGVHDNSFAATSRYYDGLVSLGLPDDLKTLSPLRCFLREQVCAFSATASDISIRVPTTFTIEVGQVGIGCIHCLKQPAHLRSNRAVCFPFSIERIYQSVADIQRFHLGECKNLPDELREKLCFLQNASSKGSKGLATRQYWMSSAKKLGLIDTPKGIRFARDPTKPLSSPSFSLDILAQAAFSVTTTSKKLVLPEDKNTIAEFLYVVMEQLQPCRFTEADRNKRRLKDVGCIGVECKHCAGQADSRKFFWSSVSAVESNFVSVHSHMFECRMVPESLKERLTELKKLRKEQTAKLMTGSQKAFFRRVWERLHDDEVNDARQTDRAMSMSLDTEDEIMQRIDV